MDETTCFVCGDPIPEGEARYVAEEVSDPRTAHVDCGADLPAGEFYVIDDGS